MQTLVSLQTDVLVRQTIRHKQKVLKVISKTIKTGAECINLA